jgi:cell division protein FtsN
MTENFENIDNLFSEAFANYNDALQKEDWQQISVALRRQNFLKFGVAHFNIYYATLLTIIAVTSIFIGTNKTILKDKPKHENTIIKTPAATSTSKPQILNLDTAKNVTKPESAGPGQTKMISNVQVNQKKDTVSEGKTDSSYNTVKNDRITNIISNEKDSSSETVATEPKSGEKKKIQKVTVVKKSTVILNDTVIQYKRK